MRGAFSGKFWQFAALASWLSLTLATPAAAEKRVLEDRESGVDRVEAAHDD